LENYPLLASLIYRDGQNQQNLLILKIKNIFFFKIKNIILIFKSPNFG